MSVFTFVLDVMQMVQDTLKDTYGPEYPTIHLNFPGGNSLEVRLINIPQEQTEKVRGLEGDVEQLEKEISYLKVKLQVAEDSATRSRQIYEDLFRKYAPTTEQLVETVKGMNRGNKIQAIKWVRDNSLMGLKEAKDFVEKVWMKNPIDIPLIPPIPSNNPVVEQLKSQGLCMATPNNSGYPCCSLHTGHEGGHTAYESHDAERGILKQWVS